MDTFYKLLVALLLIFEISAAVTGLASWNKLKNSYWRMFPIYLCIVVFIELVGGYYAFIQRDTAINLKWFRFFAIPLQFLFFYWLYHQYFKKRIKSELPKICLGVYCAVFLFDQFQTFYKNKWFDDISYSVGSILLLILVFKFISVFVNSPELKVFKKSKMFWVSLGILIYYVGSLPYWPVRVYLNENYPELFIFMFTLMYLLNYIMYSLFIVAMVWGKSE